MFRRLSVVAALVAGASLYVLAAERATFVLTNGERMSGEVVFHGSESRNLIDDFLNLGVGGGREETIPVDQVAVIDFAGGDPSSAEARALPGDDLDLLVLRNGQTERGQFVNMVRGDTLQWRNQSGAQRDIPIRDAARVYLRPSAARSVFLNNAPDNSVGTGGGEGPATATIQVPANRDWTETGMTVRQGERIAFRSRGQVRFSPDREHQAGPAGNREVRNPSVPVAGVGVGALIARIGNGQPFPIAAQNQIVTMATDGPLMLGINDNQWDDNSGQFTVEIRRSQNR
jgi:hypothetical protein